MEEKLESIKARYKEVSEELMNPDVMNDFKKVKTRL
jgi:protein subunit release factor A